MKYQNEMEQGWAFAASLAGADMGAHAASTGVEYIQSLQKVIKELEDSINYHAYRGQDIAHFQGYVQEAWHAGSFNYNAALNGSSDVARTLGSNEKWSVDIKLDSGKSYSAKSMATPEKSGIAQAAFDVETGKAGYHDQGRLVPTDHLDKAQEEVLKRAGKNSLTRPDVAAAYSEAGSELTDRLRNDEGIESIPARRDQLEEMAKKGKAQEFSAADYGLSAFHADYILKEALKAGYTTAAITVAMQLAPDIYKAIDYLIKTGELNLDQLRRTGEKAITAGAEGFLRGSIACTLKMMCDTGVFGETFQGINATMLGSVVAIVLQTVKNSILVAAGKMSASQMGAAFADSVVITGGYVLGAQIGGIVGQALGFELPVVGYLIGSLVGTSFAVIYQIGKKKLISFCVDTGFTCFGLVEQNYELPENVLHEMGVHTIPIPRTDVERSNIDFVETRGGLSTSIYETIDITVLRRGVIGVNKVGYVF